jgi:hypothetical protein
MTVELTEEQRRALARESPSPLRLVDPVSKTTYVLLPADVYEQLQSLLEEDDVRWMEPHLADLSPEDWVDAANYEQKP